MGRWSRDELESAFEAYQAAALAAGTSGDWNAWADLFTEDATYGWNLGPKGNFMCVGRDEIRDIALAQEMGGLDGWTYPYQEVLIDEKKAQVIGLWKQIADAKRADGSPYEVQGIGGSWFRYAGNFQWSWQRDFFDFGNAAHLFVEMIKDDTLSDGMKARMERSGQASLPGHYRLGDLPVGIWEVPAR